jgi:hypothetical protein
MLEFIGLAVLFLFVYFVGFVMGVCSVFKETPDLYAEYKRRRDERRGE